MLPRRINHDKEQLYSDTLKLKDALNDKMDENMKLKTKISILEKEKGREKIRNYSSDKENAISALVDRKLGKNVFG